MKFSEQSKIELASKPYIGILNFNIAKLGQQKTTLTEKTNANTR